jgi:hypothetical protein
LKDFFRVAKKQQSFILLASVNGANQAKSFLFIVLTLSYEVQHLALEKSSASLNTC